MTATDVIEVLECLKEAGIRVYVDGGWGVDALLGEQTHDHSDIDLAVELGDLDAAWQALAERGFKHDQTSEPGLPARLVLRDEPGRQVDLHPLVFDERGDGWQQLSATGRAWGRYPAGELDAMGVIDGQQVRCLSAQLQARFRMGYELSDRDEHDLACSPSGSERRGHPDYSEGGRPNPPPSRKRWLPSASSSRSR